MPIIKPAMANPFPLYSSGFRFICDKAIALKVIAHKPKTIGRKNSPTKPVINPVRDAQ